MSEALDKLGFELRALKLRDLYFQARKLGDSVWSESKELVFLCDEMESCGPAKKFLTKMIKNIDEWIRILELMKNETKKIS